MDLTLLVKSIVLGLVEGLTEFLPVSSTGHLIITGDLLRYTGEEAKTFNISIQLGAILAVCWYYRDRLRTVVRGLPHRPESRRFVLNLALGILPAAGLGVLLHGLIKAHLFTPIIVAIALIAGGFIILVVERRQRTPRINEIDEIRWSDALKLGCAQAVSLIPGTSRSGATIIGGMIFGLSRRAATEFSFFLAIPIMFLATGFDLLRSWQHLTPEHFSFFAIGFITAFLSALAAIKGLLLYVAHHDFRLFAYYRIVFGSIVLWYYWP